MQKQTKIKSILEKLAQRTVEHPNKLLYSFLDRQGNCLESYTYHSFDQRTEALASSIQATYSFLPGERVLLAYPPGLEMIVAFFACVKLGLIPVPVYPPSAHGLDSSVRKMSFIAKDCEAIAVLTNNTYHWSSKIGISKDKLLSSLTWIISDEINHADLVPLPVVDQDLLFLQYTSGSTSHPKGVMVSHENVLQNCKNIADHKPIGVSWLPQYHDMGLIGYYLFFAIEGGTTYGFSPSDFIKRPALWLETISTYKATASSAPNFAYDYCLQPGKISDEVLEKIDLSSLKFLMAAAESIKPSTYQAFMDKFVNYGLKPEAFFAAYGLAEFTLAVSNYGKNSYHFDSKQLQHKKVQLAQANADSPQTTSLMSCGKALDNTCIKIVDSENGNYELASNEVGEIWLQGGSKCRGYWKQETHSKQVFEAEIANAPESGKWLKTGDLGFLFENELFVCGRKKDLIIIRGHNYYPQDIEALVESNPFIRKGHVAAFSVEQEVGESLVVVAGIKSRKNIPNPEDLHRQLLEQLGIKVSKIVFVLGKDVSKTSSGKIRRFENKQRFILGKLPIVAQVNFELNAEVGQALKPEDIKASEISNYQTLLNYYKLTGNENTTLNHAGLDSIQVAEFSHDLESYLRNKGYIDLSHEVDIKLLQKILISDLVGVLKYFESKSKLARFNFKKAFMRIQAEHEQAELNLMTNDASLTSKKSSQTSHPFDTTTGNVFITGGTGFFGPFLIKSLLEQSDEDLYVLVRAHSKEEGFNRLMKAFKTIDDSNLDLILAFKQRVKPVCGNLNEKNLGLKAETWERLSRSIQSIYHNGAAVNYLKDYHTLRSSNVLGTKEVIEFARLNRTKTLNHISTTFIFGWSVKSTLFESDSNRDMNYLDFGYSQSKWVSDQLVLQEMKNGLNARIFRPALISPSTKGAGYNFDISIRLLAFMVKYGIGTTAQNQVSFTPADIAANNIVAIANIDSSINKTFHVTRDEYAKMSDVTSILGNFIGKKFQNYDLQDFVPEVVSRCTKKDTLFPLLNFLVKSVDNISTMEFKRYDNSNYKKFRDLSPFGRPDVPLEDVVMGIYKFMNSNNLIERES